MDASINGSIKQGKWYPLDYFLHDGRSISDMDARTILNYGKQHGHEYLSEVPDEVIEGIIGGEKEYFKYIPEYLPKIVTADRVKYILEESLYKTLNEEVVKEIIDKL